MAKDYKCWHCGFYGGTHDSTCSYKGYLNPAEPAPAAPAVRVECPCGIARTDCDYHRPASPAPYEYGAFDCGDLFVVQLETFDGTWSLCTSYNGAALNVKAQVWL